MKKWTMLLALLLALLLVFCTERTTRRSVNTFA